MTVGRAGIDGVHYLVGRTVDHRNHSAVLTRDVDQAVGREPQRMRRDIGPEVDVTDMGALLEIDDTQKMTWIGIAAVDTVAEDRHISEVGIRYHEQFVHRAGKIFQHDLRLIGNWIEKQNFCAHLVDRDHSA